MSERRQQVTPDEARTKDDRILGDVARALVVAVVILPMAGPQTRRIGRVEVVLLLLRQLVGERQHAIPARGAPEVGDGCEDGEVEKREPAVEQEEALGPGRRRKIVVEPIGEGDRADDEEASDDDDGDEQDAVQPHEHCGVSEGKT